ncbi:MAG TPA: DUF6790 family protein [Kofleriaceae bacterium]|nr:DUF6790 family protein [Kofleriaceae bacterium]
MLLLMLLAPVASIAIEHATRGGGLLALAGAWFTFWAVGLRLFTAGIRQLANPGFTARSIFHATGAEALPIVRELGFTNTCLGLLGVVSLGVPAWRVPAAIAGGLYLGQAGVLHVVRKPANPNEVVAMVSDLFVAAVIAVWLVARAC